MKNNPSIQFLSHFIIVLLTLVVLIIFRWPILLNADLFLDSDEAFNANSILGLINGKSWFFYYEGERYHGILDGLIAIPFFLFLGIKSLAYKLPTVIYFSLYIWTTWLIVKQISNSTAWILLTLMLFSPITVLKVSTTTVPHTLICLMGNVIFLCFIRF